MKVLIGSNWEDLYFNRHNGRSVWSRDYVVGGATTKAFDQTLPTDSVGGGRDRSILAPGTRTGVKGLYLLTSSDNAGDRTSAVIDDYVHNVRPATAGNMYTAWPASSELTTTEPRVKGNTYTMSFDYNSSEALGWYWYHAPSQHITCLRGQPLQILSSGGAWAKFTYTLTQTANTSTYQILFGFNGMSPGNAILYKKLKLELGPHPTTLDSKLGTNYLLRKPLETGRTYKLSATYSITAGQFLGAWADGYFLGYLDSPIVFQAEAAWESITLKSSDGLGSVSSLRMMGL